MKALLRDVSAGLRGVVIETLALVCAVLAATVTAIVVLAAI